MPECRHAWVAGLCSIQTDLGLALSAETNFDLPTKARIAVKLPRMPRRRFPVTRTEYGARMRAVNLPSTDIGQSQAPVSAFNFGV